MDDGAGFGLLPGTTEAADPFSAFPIAGQAGTALGTGTGQHGLAPQPSGGGTASNAITHIWDWINAPLTQPMSPSGLFLLVGIVIVAILLWNLILYHIRIAAEAI